MSKTPFSKKVEILGNFHLYYSDNPKDEGWEDYFLMQSIGSSLSFLSLVDVATIKISGKKWVEETWTRFCENLGLSPDGDYSEMTQMFDLSREKSKINE